MSQVGVLPGGGQSGIRHRRQAVSPRQDRHGLALRPPRSRRRPRAGRGCTAASLMQEAGLEVVGAVDDHVRRPRRAARCWPGRCRPRPARSRPGELIRRSFRRRPRPWAGPAATSVSSKRTCRWRLLSLDEVAIDDPHVPHAGADQQVGQHAAQGPAAADQRAALPQPPLALPRPRARSGPGGRSGRGRGVGTAQ